MSVEQIQHRITELEIEHQDLNLVVDTLMREIPHNDLQLQRLKKRRLHLKDHIVLLKMQLIPDVPA